MKKATCSIYRLDNIANGKFYHGQTWEENVEDRMGSNGIGYIGCRYLYYAIQHYGVENFRYTILAECATQEEADAMEDKFIQETRSNDPNIGYNLKGGGSHGKHSEETKKIIGETSRGRKHTEETKKQISETLLNHEWSEEALEAKAAVGRQWLGKKRGPQPEERKQEKSEQMTEWHATHEHPMQGKHHTEEAKAAISKAGKGRKINPKSVEQGANKRRKLTSEQELKVIAAYQAGNSISNIKKQFNIRNGIIYRTLERHNIPLKNTLPHFRRKS